MGEFPSGQRGQTVNLLLIASVVRIHLPPPAKDPPAKLVGLLLVGKDSWIRTHSNPTCRWHVGKTSANAGFLLTAFHRKAGNRIHLPRTAPPASLVGLLLVGKMRMDSNPLKSNMPVACWPDCQNSLAEFAASAAKRIRSFSAGACTWQKIHLRLQVWNLFAYGEQIMRAADCKNWRKSPKGFSDKLSNMPVACWQNQCKHWFSDTFHTERSGSPASGKRVNKRICPWQRYLFL